MSVSPSSVSPVGRATGLLAAAGVLLIGTIAVLQPIPPAARQAKSSQANTGHACTLRGRFFGALSITADWSGADLSCDGMPRPDGEGVRLFFAREQAGGGRVSVLIGIDGRTAELVGADRPANVTVIDERAGRFFSTAGPGRCWASINSVTDLPPTPGGPTGHRIDGLVYCVGALPSISDHSSLTLSDLHFAGRVRSDEG